MESNARHGQSAKWGAGLLSVVLAACGAGPAAPGEPARVTPAPDGTAVPAAASAPETPPRCPDEAPIPPAPGAASQMPRMHPAVTKAYRVDVCYWGTLDIEIARDSYLHSLHGAEPSEHALPVFPRLAAADRAVPYERSARACVVALSLVDPPTPVDGPLAEYAPFTLSLTKDIASAVQYYGSQEYLKDGFATGRDLHARLVRGFAQLARMRTAMSAAMDVYEKQRPASLCARDDAERTAQACFEKARAVIRRLGAGQGGVAAGKPDLDALAACAGARDASSGPPWVMMFPTLQSFSELASHAQVATDGRLGVDDRVELSTRFENVIEARYRAASRAVTLSAQPPPASSAAPP